MGEEGDHVMLNLALDLIDPRHVEFGVLAFFPDLLRGFLRHHAQFGERVGGMRLDLEPDAEFGLGRPDRNHPVAGVTGDHGSYPKRFAAASNADRTLAEGLISTAIPAT